MHAPIPRPNRRSALCKLAALLVVAAALGACDRHSAQPVPESYGHGSAHADDRSMSYTDHHADSTGTTHFSDTQGTEAIPTPGTGAAAASPVPAGTPAGHFF